MLGKVVGRIIGETVAAPFTVASEAERAMEEAAATIDKRVEEATEPKKGGK